jgi:hypothetical protein
VSGVVWPEIPFKQQKLTDQIVRDAEAHVRDGIARIILDPPPVAVLSKGQRVARAVIQAERIADAVRHFDAATRDQAAMDHVRSVIGWIW